MTDQAKQPEAAQEQAAPQLALQDLAAVIQIIDICSKRGAFEGAELEAVGQIRGRFARFVQANAPKQEEAPAEAQQAAAE